MQHVTGSNAHRWYLEHVWVCLRRVECVLALAGLGNGYILLKHLVSTYKYRVFVQVISSSEYLICIVLLAKHFLYDLLYFYLRYLSTQLCTDFSSKLRSLLVKDAHRSSCR